MSQTDDVRRSTSPQLARWLLGVALFVAAVSGLAVFLPGPLYRLRLLGLSAAFHLIAYGAYGGMAAVAVGLLTLAAVRFARRGLRHHMGAIVAILVGAIAWGVPYIWLKRAESVPAIHDITTDTTNPPQIQPDLIALRAAAHAANSTVYGGSSVAALQEKAYPDIRPMLFKLPADKLFATALSTAKARGWKLDSESPSTGIIEASSTTFWFGFTDDIVIRVEPVGAGSRLDIRSESRIGKSDVGRNAGRVRRFRALLYKNLGLRAPTR